MANHIFHALSGDQELDMNPGQNSLMGSVWAVCADQNIQTEGTANEGDNRSKPGDWFSGRAWRCRGECGQSGVGASSSPQGVQEKKPLKGLLIQRCPAFLPPEPGRCWASKASEPFRASSLLLINAVSWTVFLCSPRSFLFSVDLQRSYFLSDRW